ncbi:MAG: efflux RND transporter permease subunit, partial [Oscillospiraceae bacterium]|nr:efflux RND transporter permease subunit [Oscillospiraceae bacterium]
MFAKFSVKKPMTVFVAVILVLILGFVSFTSMTPDLLPNMEFPMAILVTTYPGASPEEVEMTVTKPLEQSMATLEDIENISSTSSENVSMIMLEFSQSANMDTLSADAREKISLIEGAWPDMVGTPYLMKINPNMLPIMIAAVDLDGADVYELTSFVNNTLMNKLEGTAGVASISTSGAIEKQINVLLSQEKLDKVNQELHDSMEKQFSEADEALKEAQDKLADGKNQLESGHKTLQTEMGKAESQVLSGKAMLDMADMGLTEAIEFTEEQIDQLTMDRLDLRKAIKHLDELEKKEAEFEAQIEAINQNEEMTLEEKVRAIAEITASEEYLAVQKELADFDAALAEKEMDRESLRQAYETNGEALGTA